MTARAILQVQLGPAAWRKLVLEPGGIARVGADEEAELSISSDVSLAGIHFEIDWDGTRAEVRARDGALYVGGKRVPRAWASHGCSIRAGETFFRFFAEGHCPPPQGISEQKGAGEALAKLRAEPHLWGVLDAARDDRILALLEASVDEAAHLYEGVKGAALARQAPWLVRFEAGSRLLPAIVHEGWGRGWGIFICWDAPTRDLRRHLRRFLMVEEEESGKKLYFRFYDPRVLRTFVPTCSVRQIEVLLGEAEAWLAEGAKGELVRLAPGDSAALATDDL